MFSYAILVLAALVVLAIAISNPVLVLGSFLFFSVVFPKIPVLQIQGYLVPVRAEDFFLVFAFAVVLIRMAVYGGPRGRQPLLRPMLLYSVVTLISTFLGLYVLRSVPDWKIGFLYWLRGPEYFAGAFLAIWSVHNWKSFDRLIATFIAFVGLVGVYGILQELSLVPAFDAMHTTDEVVVIRFLPGFGEERLFSTFGGPYDLSAFYIIAIPICVALLFTCSGRLRKFAVFGVLGLSVCCFYLTFARTPLPALAVAVFITLVYLGRRRLGMALAAICVVPAFLLVGFESRLQEALSDPLAEYALGNRLRTSWADCIDALIRSPLFGTGPASLHNLMGADGLYFTLVGMWGLAGLGCFLWLAYCAGKRQKQAIALAHTPTQRALAVGLFAGTVGLLINGLTIDTFFSSKIAFPYWLLMGLLTASLQFEQAPVKLPARPSAGLPPRAGKMEPAFGAGSA